jgi:transposase
MKTAVIGEDADGLVVYNRALVDLARHYGFQPRACRPYRPKTNCDAGQGQQATGGRHRLVVVAYLRGNLQAALSLREAIDKALMRLPIRRSPSRRHRALVARPRRLRPAIPTCVAA